THPSGFDHDTGLYHPERPARLKAAAEGLRQSGVAVEEVTAIPLEPADLAIVHDPVYIEAVRRFCEAGGGDLDPDTHASPGSWAAAVAAAGAGPTAVERLTAGFGGPAIVTVRPPGHHALRNRAMASASSTTWPSPAPVCGTPASGWRSSTGTSTTATAPRRRSTATPTCSTCPSTSRRSTRSRGWLAKWGRETGRAPSSTSPCGHSPPGTCTAAPTRSWWSRRWPRSGLTGSSCP